MRDKRVNETSDREQLIARLLGLLRPGIDVVVKAHPNLPAVDVGSDVDLFSLDIDYLMSEFRVATQLVPPSWNVEIEQIAEDHFHFDLVDSRSRLLFRFDLYGSLPRWKTLSIKPGFFDALIQSGLATERSDSGRWPTPSLEMEAVVRYYEFIDSFWVGRDKIHHEDWILSHLKPKQADLFFALAHSYLLSRSPTGPETSERDIRQEMRVFRLKELVRKGLRALRIDAYVARAVERTKLKRRSHG